MGTTNQNVIPAAFSIHCYLILSHSKNANFLIEKKPASVDRTLTRVSQFIFEKRTNYATAPDVRITIATMTTKINANTLKCLQSLFLNKVLKTQRIEYEYRNYLLIHLVSFPQIARPSQQPSIGRKKKDVSFPRFENSRRDNWDVGRYE